MKVTGLAHNTKGAPSRLQVVAVASFVVNETVAVVAVVVAGGLLVNETCGFGVLDCLTGFQVRRNRAMPSTRPLLALRATSRTRGPAASLRAGA